MLKIIQVDFFVYFRRPMILIGHVPEIHTLTDVSAQMHLAFGHAFGMR
jgi:hypothetical protein